MINTIKYEFLRVMNIFLRMKFVDACKFFWFLVYKSFNNKSIVFILEKDNLVVPTRIPDFKVIKITSFDEISEEYLNVFRRHMLYNTIADIKNYFTWNQVLCLGILNGKFSCYTFTSTDKEKKHTTVLHSETFENYKGKGLSPNLIYQVCSKFFDNEEILKIIAMCHINNTGSINVKYKLGFRVRD